MKLGPSILCLLFLAQITASGQLLTNDGAAIFSDNGALIFVDGEIVNQNGGTYDNSGTIELTGDWTNNAGNNAFTMLEAEARKRRPEWHRPKGHLARIVTEAAVHGTARCIIRSYTPPDGQERAHLFGRAAS